MVHPWWPVCCDYPMTALWDDRFRVVVTTLSNCNLTLASQHRMLFKLVGQHLHTWVGRPVNEYIWWAGLSMNIFCG